MKENGRQSRPGKDHWKLIAVLLIENGGAESPANPLVQRITEALGPTWEGLRQSPTSSQIQITKETK